MAKKHKETEEEVSEEEIAKQEAEKETVRLAEIEKKDNEYRTKLAEQEKKTAEANEKLAKLEGSLEAIKSFQNTTSNRSKEWTTEQWEEFEEKTGLKKETLATIDNVFGQKLKDVELRFSETAKKAEERARLAEEKFETSEKVRSYDTYKKDYFSKKPQFTRYEKEFDEFVAEFPIETRRDTEKLGKLFDKAEIYIRGKVGEKGMKAPNGGSARFGSGTGEEDEDSVTPDFSDLRAHERLTMERIVPSKESEKILKEFRHDLKGDMGVMINSKAEFDKYKKK